MTIGADGSFDKGGIGIVRFVFEARIHQMCWHLPPAQSQLYSGGNQSLDFIFCICILSAKRSKMGSSKNRGIKVFRSQQPQMDCCYKHSCSKRQLQGLGIAATLFARVWLAAYFEFSLAHFSISVPCKLLEIFFTHNVIHHHVALRQPTPWGLACELWLDGHEQTFSALHNSQLSLNFGSLLTHSPGVTHA